MSGEQVGSASLLVDGISILEAFFGVAERVYTDPDLVYSRSTSNISRLHRGAWKDCTRVSIQQLHARVCTATAILQADNALRIHTRWFRDFDRGLDIFVVIIVFTQHMGRLFMACGQPREP